MRRTKIAPPERLQRDMAQALLAAYRNDYSTPGRTCRECHCEGCLPLVAKRPCCRLAELLLAAEQIVKSPRSSGTGKRKARGSRSPEGTETP